MNAVVLCLLVLAAPPSYLKTEEKPTTRLFIRTVPSGAKIVVDGKPLGESDGLFVVPPGVRKITIELDGYRRVDRDIPVREGRIEPVEIKLLQPGTAASEKSTASKPPDSTPDSGDGKAKKPLPKPTQSAAHSAVAASYLARSDISEPERDAMLTVLRQHPGETRWSGRSEETLFAIAAKELPKGEMRQRAMPALLDLVHMLAVHELLKAKSLLDRYAATGLDDATTLRGAVEQAAGKLEVTGKVKGLIHQAGSEGDFAVGYVMADQSALTAHLLEPAELEKVRTAYRDVMHRQAGDLMQRNNWEDALLLWRHLHQRKLVSQQLYLDAARCFKELGQHPDSVRVLNEAMDAFGESGSTEFFEQAGDLALDIQSDEAQSLAEHAYEKAIEGLKETVTGADPQED